MQRPILAGLALAASAGAAPALAQFSAGAGYEYTRGDYGKTSSTEEWRIPLSLSYRTGPWSLRLSTSWMRVQGVASALDREAHAAGDGDFIGDDDVFEGDDDPEDVVGGGAGGGAATASTPARERRQSGLGDATVSVFYQMADAAAAPLGLDVGARVKIPLAGDDKCLLTNGAVDYSLQADVYQTYGKLQPSATLGWTRRGDPDRRDNLCNPLPGKVDLRNPLYAAVGLAYRLSDAASLRLGYDFRQKLRATSDARSELSLGYQHRLGGGLRLGAYAIAGFSDASPDWGLGASLAYRF